ncbi:MAG: hypothetical protein AAGH43_03375 [Pseudomonadota bacterium]
MGVLAFQMPIDNLNAVMQSTIGLSESGETFLVGGDLLMRTDSRFSEESTILTTIVDSAAVAEALCGQAGLLNHEGAGGVASVNAFTPVDFLGTQWALIASMD